MNRKTKARERRCSKAKRRQKTEANDEEVVDFNYENDSENNTRYTSTPMKKVKTISGTVRLERIKAAENNDSEESLEMRPRGRSLRRPKIAKTSREEDEIFREEGTEEEDRRKRRGRRPKRGRSSDHLGKSQCDDAIKPSRSLSLRMRGGEDDTEKQPRRKTNRFQAEGTIELPITEILKKAQENNQTKYEEPVPLPELTTDTMYVQGRNGFSAVKIGRDPYAQRRHRFVKMASQPIQVAIEIQRIWKSMSLIFQGLFGGVALMQFVMIEVFYDETIEFLNTYSKYSEIYTNMFSCFGVICCLAAMDKFDVAHLDVDHLREIFVHHILTAITIPMYLITFCLHQVTIKIDDKLSLMIYDNSAMLETLKDDEKRAKFFRELNWWRDLTLWKNLLALFAWVLVAIGTRGDLLLIHLEAMAKYADQPELIKE